MKLHRTAQASLLALILAGTTSLAFAQNIAIVNGKAVPVSRLAAAKDQLARTGQPVPPEMEGKVKEQLVLREIFVQEAERKGMAATPDYRDQMDMARQSVLIQALFDDFKKNNAATDAEAQAQYDSIKASVPSKEFQASHILVEKEDQAKAIITKLKAGAKFAVLAKESSKDPGSAQNGGDLGWAAPDSFVPEFSDAMVKLEKGKFTQEPVKSQFGYHIIMLTDVRDTAQSLPPFADVKEQLKERLTEEKLAEYRETVRKQAKTDFKFSEE